MSAYSNGGPGGRGPGGRGPGGTRSRVRVRPRSPPLALSSDTRSVAVESGDEESTKTLRHFVDPHAFVVFVHQAQARAAHVLGAFEALLGKIVRRHEDVAHAVHAHPVDDVAPVQDA